MEKLEKFIKSIFVKCCAYMQYNAKMIIFVIKKAPIISLMSITCGVTTCYLFTKKIKHPAFKKFYKLLGIVYALLGAYTILRSSIEEYKKISNDEAITDMAMEFLTQWNS